MKHSTVYSPEGSIVFNRLPFKSVAFLLTTLALTSYVSTFVGVLLVTFATVGRRNHRLSVCLSVCLFVSAITRKVMDRFLLNLNNNG